MALVVGAVSVITCAMATEGPAISTVGTFDGSLNSTRAQAMAIAAPHTSRVGASSNDRMSVPGELDVSAQGAATYTIPIKVPPGTAGMVPALSLAYSSQGGNGELGLGWSLSGLDSISRCALDMARDGVLGNVNFDGNDRFCLGGQRLVAISGNYGSNGTEYRTEIDSYARIISYGSTGGGPTYFRVWKKSGEVLEFGNTSDSRDLTTTGSGTVRAWLVNRVSDHKGNYYSVSYTNDNANGQVYVNRIDYTGNTAAGLSPYNSVQFSYGSRQDIVPKYHGGSLTRTTVLLTNIRTYAGSNLVSDYRLAYEAGTTLHRSRLTSVTLCDGSNTCLAPTSFTWQGTRSTITATHRLIEQSATANYYFDCSLHSYNVCFTYNGPVVGDFDGDGISDYLNPANQSLMLGTGLGNFQLANWGPSASQSAGDKNKDGITDIIQSDVGESCGDDDCTRYEVRSAYFSNGNHEWGNWDTIGQFPSVACGVGCDENNQSPHESVMAYMNRTSWSDPLLVQGDFDGDGCPYPDSFLLHDRSSTHQSDVWLACNPPNRWLETTSVLSTFDGNIVGDFNGDGLDDVASGTAMILSTGRGFVPAPVTGGIPNSIAGDWNGDGLTDYALLSDTVTFYLSTGNGGFVEVGSTLESPYGNIVVADVNSDGASDIVFDNSTYSSWSIETLQLNYTPELMIGINNGIGKLSTITYDRLGNSTIYTRDTDAAWPQRDISGAIYVVSRVDSSNGIGGNFSSTYHYTGAKKDFRRGFLGYRQIAQTDLQTGLVTTTTYRQDFPFVGKIASQITVSGSAIVAEVVNTYGDAGQGTGTDGVAKHDVHLTQSIKRDYLLKASPQVTTTTNYSQFDSFGNPSTVNISVSDGSYRNSTLQYLGQSTDPYLASLLARTNVTGSVGSSTITRTSCSIYNAQSGVKDTDVLEPTSSCTPSSNGVQTNFSYDNFGNPTQVIVSGPGVTTRTTTTSYDSLGQFPTQACNALSQCETMAYDAQFGAPTSRTDINGLTTSWSYDTFGRPALSVRPDGTRIVWWHIRCSDYVYPASPCTWRAATATSVYTYASDGVTQISPYVRDHYDALGRHLLTETAGLSGDYIYQLTYYDSNGNVLETSRPFYQALAPALWTVFSYDTLGRVTQTTQPDGRVDTASYDGLTNSVTVDYGGKNQTTTTVKNAQGLTASVTDALNQTTNYTYDAFGNLKTITDPAGNVTTNTYDVRGNRTASSDPDMGSWSYGYDVLGQLISQTDAKSQASTLSYDVLGRLAGATEGAFTRTFAYDSAAHGIGLLASTASSDTTSRTFAYDTLSRPSSATVAVDGATYPTSTTYNSDGRVATLTYSSGFSTRYVYTSGYLSEIRDNATNALLWRVNARDAEMHLTSQTFGNGVTQTNTFDANTGLLSTIRAGANDSVAALDYTFDSVGNLAYRSDNFTGTFERFCYDGLNRLTEYAAGPAVTACISSQNHKTVAYNAIGNITGKSDVGSYAYPAPGQARPHATSSVTGTVNGVVNPSFTYDANGNLTSGAGRTVGYTVFNMTASITQGTTSFSYAYDATHNRVKQTETKNGATTTTIYVDDLASGFSAEKIASSPSTYKWNDYIVIPGGVSFDGKASGIRVGMHVTTVSGTGTSTANRYFVLDHLGSTAVIADDSGAVVERSAYDPWGKRRYPNGNDDTAGALRSQTNRGFTSHEHIDDVGLINMNARVYDPQLGRFMSADPITATPYDAQSLNRYTYVDNKPLSSTDLTGLVCDDFGCSSDVAPFFTDVQVENTAAMDESMRNNQGAVTPSATTIDEPMVFGTGSPEGPITVRHPTDTQPGSSAGGDHNQAGRQKGDIYVLHGHLGRTILDDNRQGRGPGDSQSQTLRSGGIPNGARSTDGRLLVREVKSGVLQARMLTGKLTSFEKREYQKHLDQEQALFNNVMKEQRVKESFASSRAAELQKLQDAPNLPAVSCAEDGSGNRGPVCHAN